MWIFNELIVVAGKESFHKYDDDDDDDDDDVEDLTSISGVSPYWSTAKALEMRAFRMKRPSSTLPS